jgi:beta-galactosidase
MRPTIWLLAAISLVSVLGGGAVRAEDGRVGTVNLCGDWAFAYTVDRAQGLPPAEAFKASMPVPGCWDDVFDGARARAFWPSAKFNPDYQPIRFPTDNNHLVDPSFPFLLGTGWYRRQIDVPAAWKGRQITLQVARVVMDAWVYVNGREVHHHFGHSTNWEMPLGPHLNFGQPNELVIAVDNTRTDRANSSIINGWTGRSAGIFGPVLIRLAGAARIADVYVFPDKGRLNWRVEVQGDLPKLSQLRWQIRDPKTKRVVGRGTQQAAGGENCWDTETFGLKPWSEREPNLYELEVGLNVGDDALDICRQPFGLRRLTTAGTKLRLNERPIFLRGHCDHSYYPLTCTPPTDIAWYREHIRRLKELGFNWIRFHTATPLEPCFEAADELGMLIQVEPPVNYAFSEWCDILRACRRHPSVVIYCCGNEDLLDEAKIEYIAKCEKQMRAVVPDALFNPQEALRGIEYGWAPTDLGKDTVEQPFHHNPKRLARLKEFSDVLGQHAWGWLSYDNLDGVPEKIDQQMAIYERPCLTHELGIAGCYINLKLEERYRKLRAGHDLYAAAQEQIAKAGLLDRADTYYRNAAALQRLILKDAMETARACQLTAGYDCIGAADLQWPYCGYECGLMNEFDELKPGRTAEDIRCFNGESVLTISERLDRRLVAGRPLQRKVLLSWFGDGTLRNAPVRWSLKATDGTVLAKGEQMAPEVAAGTVAQLATIDAPMPKLERPTKATLTVELQCPGDRVHNQWDFWLFPAGQAKAPDNVRVVSELDAAVIDALAAGQRVVLLGTKPFSARSTRFRSMSAGRAEGDVATVIARHPLTDQMPNDGFGDWQFYQMLSGAASVQFDDMPEAFDPIVEVVCSYKQVHRQAAVFEWRVGSGRLLVCSLSLNDWDPAGAYFRRCLLAYAGGEQFQPRTKVSPERLKQLLKLPGAVIGPAANPNQAFDPRRAAPPKKTQKAD